MHDEQFSSDKHLLMQDPHFVTMSYTSLAFRYGPFSHVTSMECITHGIRRPPEKRSKYSIVASANSSVDISPNSRDIWDDRRRPLDTSDQGDNIDAIIAVGDASSFAAS